MKKYTSILLSLVLVLGFAASAFAIHAEIPLDTQSVVAKGSTQITIDGDLRFRGRILSNTQDFNSNTQRTGDNSFYDSRVRLGVTAQVTPNTLGRILLESGASDNDTSVWGNNAAGVASSASFAQTSGAKGSAVFGEYKIPTVAVLEAYILHQGQGLLGTPAFVKVGHMPIKVGNGLFYSHTRLGDDAILLGLSPVKGADFILGTVHQYEGQNFLADDAATVALLLAYSWDPNSKVGLDVTYTDWQNIGHSTVAAGLFPDAHLWNIGLNGKTMIGGFGIGADIQYQFGKLTDAGATNPKFKGYAATLDASYTFNPVTVKAGFGYGSGKDKDDTSVDVKTFFTSQDVAVHYTYVYEYFTPNAAGLTNGGLQNTWYLKLGAAADITKEVYADLTFWYLRAAKNAVVGLADGTSTKGDSKNIGWEVDANVKYKFDKNITYFVEGGYLFAGKFWDRATFGADNAYALRHGVQLSF